ESDFARHVLVWALSLDLRRRADPKRNRRKGLLGAQAGRDVDVHRERSDVSDIIDAASVNDDAQDEPPRVPGGDVAKVNPDSGRDDLGGNIVQTLGVPRAGR